MLASESINLEGARVTLRSHPVFHVIIDNVFGGGLNQSILNHIISLENHFALATLGGGRVKLDVRSNTVCNIDSLFERPDFVSPDGSKDMLKMRSYRAEQSPLLGAIDSLIMSPFFATMMDSAPFPLCKFRRMNRWETRVSRYGSMGQHYSWHHDRGMRGDERTITMNYYVFRTPKAFTGGELRLTPGILFKGELVGGDDVVEVEPRNDRLVVFGSRVVHSVETTKSPERFEDGRFSVNVWIGRKDAFDPQDQW